MNIPQIIIQQFPCFHSYEGRESGIPRKWRKKCLDSVSLSFSKNLTTNSLILVKILRATGNSPIFESKEKIFESKSR